MSKYRFDIHI